MAGEGGRWRETGIGDGGGRGDRRGTGTGIRTCRIQIQVEYSECCCILGVFWLYELDYNATQEKQVVERLLKVLVLLFIWGTSNPYTYMAID